LAHFGTLRLSLDQFDDFPHELVKGEQVDIFGRNRSPTPSRHGVRTTGFDHGRAQRQSSRKSEKVKRIYRKRRKLSQIRTSPQPLVLHQFPQHAGGAGFFRAEGFEVAGEVIGDFYDTLATGHVGVSGDGMADGW
jgi:hypothetical protein